MNYVSGERNMSNQRSQSNGYTDDGMSLPRIVQKLQVSVEIL